MASDLTEIVHNLRMQIGHKGAATLSSLARHFRDADHDRSGVFLYPDFEEVLGKAGLFMKRQELTKLYRYFDPELREALHYKKFLRELQGEPSPRRVAIMRLVWDKLSCGRPRVPVKLIIGAYSTAAHPRVMSGEKTQQEAFREFVINLENASNVDGDVSWEQFKEYYCLMSASVPYNDDYFVGEMEQAWGVTENTTRVPVPGVMMRKVHSMLREKIRQRSKQDGAEAEQLRLTFKHFDIANRGVLDYKGFLAAFQRYGLILDQNTAEGLFADFEQPGGVLNYAEFVAALYHGEDLHASRKGVTRSSPGELPAPTPVFVLGGPGAGTSVFCAKARAEFGFVHLNVLDLIRAEGFKKTAIIGKTVDTPRVRAELLLETMRKYGGQGKLHFLLDNFPASLGELDAWDAAAAQAGVAAPVAVFLDAPTAVLEQRLVVKDPKMLRVGQAMQVYSSKLLPVVDELKRRNVLAVVDANDSEHVVYSQVRQSLANMMP